MPTFLENALATPDGRLNELDRVFARPFGGAGERRDLAAVGIDQDGVGMPMALPTTFRS